MNISPEYRELNRKLHEDREDYGAHGDKWADLVAQLARMSGATSILDYGCGKRTLEKALGYAIWNYDPAIEGLDNPPMPADLVVCTDVLEHVEPALIDNVLDDLRRLTKDSIFLVIATRPAKKTLADGRNAHLIQENAAWWLRKLLERFTPMQFNNIGGGEFLFIGSKA